MGADSDSVVADPDFSEEEWQKDKADFAGTYYCARTRDVFHFDVDGKGYFRAGSEIARFEWKKNSEFVAVIYMEDGKVTSTNTLVCVGNVLIEKSEMLGELQFVKEEE